MATTKQVTQPLFKFASRVPFNIAPEQGARLASEIFGPDLWELRPSQTEANFYASPADRAIYLSYAGLASLWCVSYAAFQIANIASCAQRTPKGSDQKHIDASEEFRGFRISEHVSYARSLCRSDSEWPDELYKPQLTPPSDSVEARINNAFYGALSWIILHEIAHVHHNDTKFVPANLRVRQEYQADTFATKWIFENAGTGLKREFRILVVTIALSWLFLHEQTVGVGSYHPPAILRFREAIQYFGGGDRSPGLENAAYILKVLFDPTTPPPVKDTPKELFAWTCERMETLFGSI